jgi:hypothetical protein
LLHRLVLFAFTLVTLFLVLRDGAWLADRALATAGHLLGHPGQRLVRKIADAIRATVSGTVAAAVVKGAVIGVAYVLTGVPHPLLFTVLTINRDGATSWCGAALRRCHPDRSAAPGGWLPVLPASAQRHCDWRNVIQPADQVPRDYHSSWC